jgi:lipoprotein-anchoring transpeptidase ErfK/SrfK
VSLVELARMRWLGETADLDLDVETTVPEAAIDAFVARLGGEIDREPVEAELRLVGREPQLVEGATGARSGPCGGDRAAPSRGGRRRATDGERESTCRSRSSPRRSRPSWWRRSCPRSAPPSTPRSTTRCGSWPGERQWTVTARDLDAVPDLTPAIEALTALGTVRAVASSQEDEPEVRAEELDVPLRLADEPVAVLVEEIAAEVEVPVRDARLDTDGGWVTLVPERTGYGSSGSRPPPRCAQAVLSGDEEVEVQTVRTSPSVTRAAYPQVLLVRQDDRRVYLYQDGQIVRDWPAAIGTSDYPTPTGRFVVGAKRYEPTWTNPSPDDWGYGAPAFMGPGPNNPLGPRAINWNRPSGRDSLIRFHGTPDEHTIGQAATHGCVRMYNRHVIELYDLVETGTTIVSVP